MSEELGPVVLTPEQQAENEKLAKEAMRKNDFALGANTTHLTLPQLQRTDHKAPR